MGHRDEPGDDKEWGLADGRDAQCRMEGVVPLATFRSANRQTACKTKKKILDQINKTLLIDKGLM